MKDFTFSKRIKKASLFIPLLMLSLFFSQGINAQALSGAYTVDSSSVASSTNFVSISSMATALNTNGVSGPVTITVTNDRYYDTLYLGNISGASAVNNIVIDGGDSSQTFVSHDGSSNYATLTLNGTKHVTFKNITFEMTKSNNAAVILLKDAEHNTITNCESRIAYVTAANGLNNIIFSSLITGVSNNSHSHYNTIKNNRILGGHKGIVALNSGPNNNVTNIHNLAIGNKFNHNAIDSIRQYGVDFMFHDSLEFIGNTIDALTNAPPPSGFGGSVSYGLNFQTIMNSDIKQNYVWSNSASLTIANSGLSVNNDFVAAGLIKRRSEVSNNMLYSKASKGMYLNFVDSVDIWHNTVNVEGAQPSFHLNLSSSYTAINNDVRNNIFSAKSSEAVLLGSSTNTNIIVSDSTMFRKFDNNLYYSATGNTLLQIGTTAYSDLATYQQAQPLFNTGSIEADPQFVSATDLHIAGVAPYEAGDNSVGITVDIDGKPRPGPNSTIVDIGADEFIPPACSNINKAAVSEEDFDAVSLSWISTSLMPTKEFQYEVFTCDSQLVVSAVTSLDSIRITSLTANSCYNLNVREICTRGDTSAWYTIDFYTLQKTPYFEDFEHFVNNKTNPWPYNWTSKIYPTPAPTNTDPKPRWQSETAIGSNQGTNNTGPIYDHTQFGTPGGKYMLVLSSMSGFSTPTTPPVGDSADFTSAPIHVDPNTNVLELSYSYFMFGANIDRMKVMIDTNGVEEEVAIHIGAQQSLQTDNWKDTSIYLHGYEGKSVKLMFRGYKSSGGVAGDIAIDDIVLKEAPNNDAGMVDFIAQSAAFCAGSNPVTAVIKNYGFDTLKTATVVWDINGVKDSTSFSGVVLAGDTAHVNLGSVTLSSSQINNIIIYTSTPNGVTDEFYDNDTLKLDGIGLGLNGTYTVNAALPASATNFQTLDSLSNYLTANGICGPTTIDVAAGVYNEPLYLENIQGLSATNNLVIDGGDSSQTIVTHDGRKRYATLTISRGANHIHLTNMSFKRTFVASLPDEGAAVLFAYNPEHITISNSVLWSEHSTSSNQNRYVVLFSGSASSKLLSATERASYITVENNRIVGGYHGIESRPQATSTHLNVYNQYINNTFDSIYSTAVNLRGQDSLEFIGNNVDMLSENSTSRGLVFDHADNTIVSKNNILANGYGLTIDNNYRNNPINRRYEISNNMIYSKNNNAMRLSGLDSVDIFHNSFNSEGTSTMNTAYGIYIFPPSSSRAISSYDVRNNIFKSKNTIAFSSPASDTIFDNFDHNIFYNTASTLMHIGGVDYSSLSAYLAANTVHNQNSIEADPGFVSDTDLHIDAASTVPAERGDNTVGLTTDIDGDFRPYPQTLIVDIGADEYLPTAVPTSYYPIGTINTSDVDGLADSINVEAWTSGTVVGLNLNSGNGLGFTIIDMSSSAQEGIFIYSENLVSNYNVSEGDSIKVRGVVGQTNGLTQMEIDFIEVISTGNTIPTPRSVTVLDESTESQYLEIEKFVLLDSSGVGTYSMRAYNGTDTIAININAQTAVSDSLAEVNNSLVAGDTLCVMLGVGGQYDTSSTAPFLSGYYITPMYYSDLTVCKYTPTPYYPIGTLNTSDMDGVADSINVEAWTSGTVVGVNLNAGNGIGFTLIDMSSGSQEGIYIHSNSAVSSYSVSEGDSIKVLGTVAQSNGLTEFVADSIEVISTGNATPTPRSVTVLDESTESQYLEIEKFVLLDSSGVGTYSMRAYNGTDTIAININALTDVSDSLADVNNSLLAGDTICMLLGIGGQYDTSSTAPFLSGYHITPMYFTDLTICKDVTIGITKNTGSVDNLTFYPNPTTGSFTIATSGLENDNAIITIRDISGKVIVRESIINSSSAFKKHYSLEGQAKGMYFISIIDGEKRINKKLILQ